MLDKDQLSLCLKDLGYEDVLSMYNVTFTYDTWDYTNVAGITVSIQDDLVRHTVKYSRYRVVREPVVRQETVVLHNLSDLKGLFDENSADLDADDPPPVIEVTMDERGSLVVHRDVIIDPGEYREITPDEESAATQNALCELIRWLDVIRRAGGLLDHERKV